MLAVKVNGGVSLGRVAQIDGAVVVVVVVVASDGICAQGWFYSLVSV